MELESNTSLVVENVWGLGTGDSAIVAVSGCLEGGSISVGDVIIIMADLGDREVTVASVEVAGGTVTTATSGSQVTIGLGPIGTAGIVSGVVIRKAGD